MSAAALGEALGKMIFLPVSRAMLRARYSSGRKMIRWAPSEATTSAALPLVQQMSVSALTSAYVFT